jgi:hypothetical protein
LRGFAARDKVSKNRVGALSWPEYFGGMNQILSGAIAESPVAAHMAVNLVYRDVPIDLPLSTRYALRTREDIWEALLVALLMLSALAAIASCFSSAILSLAYLPQVVL